MKKLLNIMLLGVISSSSVFFTISCNSNSLNSDNFFKNIKSFDWSNSATGDGINFNNYNSNHKLNDNNFITNKSFTINPENESSVLNYANFNTGFQWSQNIEKQAVTGVPLDEGFMPNGNKASYYGVNSEKNGNALLNSILNWSPTVDKDAKYNKSTIPLQKREFVAASDVATQDKSIKFNQISFSTRKHRTFDNSVVGSYNPFEDTPLEWQSMDAMVNWAGSWYEGPIVPPSADMIDMAHKNGTKIYGDVFLDGGHGLTRDMLKDFIAQNSDGTYKIVNILINIALYNGFDGWFINNESNGSLPSGSVLNYHTMCNIIKQFNATVAKSKNKLESKLRLFYYNSSSSVAYDPNNNRYVNPEIMAVTKTGATQIIDNKQEPLLTNIQLNFGEKSNSTQHFLNNNKSNYQGNNLYTIYDMSNGANTDQYGTFNPEQYIFRTNDNDDLIPNNNFSYFMNEGPGLFGNAAYNFALSEQKKHPKSNDFKTPYLFADQVTNLYNSILYNGYNGYVSDTDNGLSNYNSNDNFSSNDFANSVLAYDPRINIPEDYKKDLNPNSKITYIYNSENSFGIDDYVWPKTRFFDDGGPLNLTTDFSTGNGISYFDNGNISASQFPWTNRRIADILPTYQWDIKKKWNNEFKNVDPSMFGYYDYQEAFNKGNSIAIGGGFDQNGDVLPAKWDLNTKYFWDIMGTNLSSSNNIINITYNDNRGLNGKNAIVTPFFEIFNTISNQKRYVLLKNEITTTEGKKFNLSGKINDTNWETDSINLNTLSNEQFHPNAGDRIAKIGVEIKPQNNSFKLNIGELSITSSSQNSNVLTAISKPQSEYVIKRLNNEKNPYYDIRFQWESNINALDEYFKIYVQDNDNNIYFIGMTTQNCYYLKNLTAINNQLKILIQPVVNNEDSNFYAININV